MRTENGLIVFEHLSVPSETIIGEKENVKAVPDNLSPIGHLIHAENLGKSMACNLKYLFC